MGSTILILTTIITPFLALETRGLPTSTKSKSSSLLTPRNAAVANPNIEITIHNALNTGKPLYVYVTGLPYLASTTSFSGNEAMLQADNTWDVLDAGGSEIPLNVTTNVAFHVPAAGASSSVSQDSGGSRNNNSSSFTTTTTTTTFTLPSYVSSARVYVFEGTPMQWQMVSTATSGAATSIVQPVVTEPGTTAYDNRWGFIEFTSSADQFFVDVSYVDFVSLGMGLSVVDDGNGVEYVVPGLSDTLLQEMHLLATNASSSSSSPHGAASSTAVQLPVPPFFRNLSTTTTTTTKAKTSSFKSQSEVVSRQGRNATRQQETSILDSICSDLRAQSQKDGNAWEKLCIYTNSSSTSSSPSVLRILSPEDGLQQNIAFANVTYYDDYIAAVWAHYTTHPLYVDTQNPQLGTLNATLVSCAVAPATDQLVCSGSAVGMPRPTTADIWGCNSGAFALNATADAVFRAVVPRVCAAFTRSTLLLPAADPSDPSGQNNATTTTGTGTTTTTTTININNVQPGPANSTFYQADITNHYARVIHEHEGLGGYAFAYDDVGVYGENQEGAIQVGSARKMDVYVG